MDARTAGACPVGLGGMADGSAIVHVCAGQLPLRGRWAALRMARREKVFRDSVVSAVALMAVTAALQAHEMILCGCCASGGYAVRVMH